MARKRPFLDDMDSIEAKFLAQRLAFGPMMFQAARSLRTLGILDQIKKNGLEGTSEDALVEATGVPRYGVRLLLEAGLVGGLLSETEAGWVLTKMGYMVLVDRTTRTNMDFVHDVCYRPAFHLESSLLEGKPVGLEEFGGDWATVYEALPELPKPVRESWFAFDHFYSDGVFNSLLPRIFSDPPARILDVGGNTGRWALACCAYDPDVEVTIVDLPGQLRDAMRAATEEGYAERIHGFPCDLLSQDIDLPVGYDVIWMSQFLDCFSEEEIVTILKHTVEVMSETTRLYILETFWDLQRYEAARFSVVQTSLYFASVANGKSKMYHSERMLHCLEEAGVEVCEIVRNVGVSHTLLECRRARLPQARSDRP
jgi:hypothetical protein